VGRAVRGQGWSMSLPVGVCLGDGTVILLRAQPTSARAGEESSSHHAPIVVHDVDLLGEVLTSFQAAGAGAQ